MSDTLNYDGIPKAKDIIELRTRDRYEGSLFEFLKDSWPWIDSSEFKPSWAIDAMCDHLENVTFGNIKRLLINVPPRCSKTLISSVCWPAWTWARSEINFTSGPQVRFLTASYNDRLALMAATRMRRLLLSPFYQRFWGSRFALQWDQQSKGHFDNTKGGARISTSVRGGLLGLGGDVICFPYDEVVRTERGLMSIGEIVSRRLNVSVWSFDPKTGATALKPITGWHRNARSYIVQVTLSDGSSFRCTPDHKIWTKRGWVEATNLLSSDVLPRFTQENVSNGDAVNVIFSGECALAQLRCANIAHVVISKLGVWMINAKRAIGVFANTFRNIHPCSAVANLLNGGGFHSEALANINGGPIGCSYLDRLSFSELGSRTFFVHRERSVSFSIIDVLRSRSVFQIGETWITAVSVFMSRLLATWALADKRLHHKLMAEAVDCFAVDAQRDTRVSFVQDRSHNPAIDDAPSIRAHAFEAFNATESGDSIARGIDDRSPTLVEFVGHVDETFCLTVADYNTFVVGSGDIIVKNCCDDPHNTETEKAIETDADRNRVASWWQELSSTRLNDPKQSAIVVVMQRLHEQDLSGVILDSEEEFTHLMVPMRYDQTRHCVTVPMVQYEDAPIWEDPRGEIAEIEGHDGQLMWPERFGEKEVEHLENRLGPYLSAGRLQQMPVPKGGGIILRDWWKPWDEIEATQYGLTWSDNLKEFPHFELVWGSLDTAFKEKEENDFSAMTVWGLWMDKTKTPRVMLMYGWAKRLRLHGPVIEQKTGEANVNYKQRQQAEWGLIEWIADTAKRYKIQRLLIEDKSRGYDVAMEINRLYARENWGVELLEPVGDKVSRAHSCVPCFTDGAVWAPFIKGYPVKWANDVITQASQFPKATHDDLLDTITQSLNWARVRGLILRGDEVSAALEDESKYLPKQQTVAESYGI